MNTENLFRILKDNSETKYGEEYDFANIRDEKEYKLRVPVTKYEDYDNICEPGNYTVYSIHCYLETSGTTGRQKVFPLTEEALRRYGSHICDMPYQIWPDSKNGPHLHTSVFRRERNGKTLLSAAYYRWLLRESLLDANQYVGGKELMFSDSITNVVYVKVWLALSSLELVSIQSIFVYDVLLMMGYLEKYWQDILADMRGKTVSVELDEWVKALLLKHIPKEDVLKQMEQILSEGFDKPIIPRLWKNIRFISGIGGNSMDVQVQALKRYSGDVPVYYFAYASSECMMGIALYDYRPVYKLLPDSAYYEFMKEDGNFEDMNNLIAGQIYEPVITTFSGLYRYRTGDMIRVLDYEDGLPVFEVLGRVKVLNIAGEKLSETFVQFVIRKWAAVCKIQLADYSVGVDDRSIPGNYLVFTESEGGDIKDTVVQVLENILSNLSEDYADLRTLGMLEPVKVFACDKGIISKTISSGKGHKKHQMFLPSEQVTKLLKVSRLV